MTDPAPEPELSGSLQAVFAPVHSQTAFEETVERLGTAIRLGLLRPGTRLPAGRQPWARVGSGRSTRPPPRAGGPRAGGRGVGPPGGASPPPCCPKRLSPSAIAVTSTPHG